MSETSKISGSEKSKKEQSVEPWLLEHVREILRAQGRLIEVDVDAMDKDELREKVENVARSRRMREASFSITRELGSGLSGERIGTGSRRLIWDEVKSW